MGAVVIIVIAMLCCGFLGLVEEWEKCTKADKQCFGVIGIVVVCLFVLPAIVWAAIIYLGLSAGLAWVAVLVYRVTVKGPDIKVVNKTVTKDCQDELSPLDQLLRLNKPDL